jgi:ABC-type antimicrobial peptide transport system permease subunit
VVVALGTSRLLETQLYGVRPHDPLSYGTTVLLLGAAAAVACWIPARRATNVSPMEALRAE